MMLDKGQIKDWDGEPEEPPAPQPAAKGAAAAAVQTPAQAVAQPSTQTVSPPEPKPAAAPEPLREQPEQDQRYFGEARPTGETVQLSPQQEKARKRRGQWLALGLFAFVILVFVLTMTKIGAQILVRDL